MEENTLQNMATVNIWSDGGPKHFKISSNMKFLATLQHYYKNIDWTYNFFPPYHGCSVCDGAAAQAKKKVTTSMMDTGIAIRTSEQVVAQVGKLKNHVVSKAVMAKGSFATPTLTGIRKYFKFTAHKSNDWIYAFSDSIQTVHENRYCEIISQELSLGTFQEIP